MTMVTFEVVGFSCRALFVPHADGAVLIQFVYGESGNTALMHVTEALLSMTCSRS